MGEVVFIAKVVFIARLDHLLTMDYRSRLCGDCSTGT